MDPYVKNPSAAANPGLFTEGDRVRFLFGPTPVEAIIAEDVGILNDGHRYYVVRFEDGYGSDPIESMRSAEELTLVSKAPRRSRKGKGK